MGVAEIEGAGAGLVPAGDAGVAAGVEVDVCRDLGSGLCGADPEGAGGGAAGYGYCGRIGKAVFCAEDGGVGAQGQAQGQNQCQGEDAFLHVNLLLSYRIGPFEIALH